MIHPRIFCKVEQSNGVCVVNSNVLSGFPMVGGGAHADSSSPARSSANPLISIRFLILSTDPLPPHSDLIIFGHWPPGFVFFDLLFLSMTLGPLLLPGPIFSSNLVSTRFNHARPSFASLSQLPSPVLSIWNRHLALHRSLLPRAVLLRPHAPSSSSSSIMLYLTDQPPSFSFLLPFLRLILPLATMADDRNLLSVPNSMEPKPSDQSTNVTPPNPSHVPSAVPSLSQTTAITTNIPSTASTQSLMMTAHLHTTLPSTQPTTELDLELVQALEALQVSTRGTPTSSRRVTGDQVQSGAQDSRESRL
jgi:hypothetical protein